MIAFIDDHREVYGVEPICKVLPIAPSTYHDHVAKRVDPSKLSVRAHRDLVLKPENSAYIGSPASTQSLTLSGTLAISPHAAAVGELQLPKRIQK